jgi:WD40-like Beta Propeller Repeat
VRRELERVEIPGEHEARERTWAVVERAFAEREPSAQAPRVRFGRPAIALAAVVVALAAVAAGLAGPALVRSVREAVGVEHAQQALVALPSPGRLLVESSAGAWIVSADGSKRLLGRYAESSWSPHGLFVVVARGHELAAVDPKGNVRWSLERAGPIHDPRWSPDGYRIAYRSGRSLRVVAGDGTGDRLLVARVAPIAPEWRGEAGVHALAYTTASGALRTVDADTGALLPSTRLRPKAVVTYDALHDRSSVQLRGVVTRTLFQGTGRIDGVALSPDGRWLLVAWRSADQWVFVRTSGPRRIRAVASISAVFHSTSFPRVTGWCC